MNTLDKQYTDLLKTILEYGAEKEDRTGTGTKSIFGYTIRHNMKEGFPLLTTKKMHSKSIISELLWFLQGRTDLRFLLEHDNHIWTGDAYKVYDKDFDAEHPPFSGPYPLRLTKQEFEEKIMNDDEFNRMYGDLGPIYGKQWRNWGGNEKVAAGWHHGAVSHYRDRATFDQITKLIHDLKTNPDSRRLMVSAWNVGELDQMTLPPCHYGFQVYTRELSLDERLDLMRKRTRDGTVDYDNRHHGFLDFHNIPKRAISLMWNQRSVDTFLGLPFNIASYGLLLEIIAKTVNMVPDQLIGSLGDTHLYLDHIDQANQQIGRPLSRSERMDWWFHNNKPNRDVCDYVDELETAEAFEYLDQAGVPTTTRSPFKLPSLKHMKEDDFYKSLGKDFSLISHLDINDFVIEGYQSHPAIKAPLSN